MSAAPAVAMRECSALVRRRSGLTREYSRVMPAEAGGKQENVGVVRGDSRVMARWG